MNSECYGTVIFDTPIIIVCFAIFLIGITSWWFLQLILNPESMFNRTNIFLITKANVLIAAIGLIKMKKWSVY